MQVRQLPNRDHRQDGITTLKCASAHVPRFLTGSDASKKPSATSPAKPQLAQAVSTAHRWTAAQDGFLGCRAPQ